MLKLGKKKGADAAVPAVTDGESVDGVLEDGAPKKKKIPILFLIIPAALVVLGGGGAAAFFLMQPKAVSAEEGAEAGDHSGGGAEDKKDEKGGGHGEASAELDPALGKVTDGPDGVIFYTLPPMTVNIQSADNRATFLKLNLTLETKDRQALTTLQTQMPRLQDMLNGFLREMRPEDLSGSSGTYQLRAEILRRVNLIAAPAKVDAVLIEEMLVN